MWGDWYSYAILVFCPIQVFWYHRSSEPGFSKRAFLFIPPPCVGVICIQMCKCRCTHAMMYMQRVKGQPQLPVIAFHFEAGSLCLPLCAPD